MQFLDFITSLAGEGETALIVKQEPNKNGETHADGAVKCSWPAYLPSAWKPGHAWYGNTGAFIVSRFKDGKPSASGANVDFVIVMVLDDVGTKSKVPPLEPTWKMETSPGNYQWGYVFSEQPTAGEFSAAIKAIADAGYTDKGAINPVRNFRLPGSINLKPGREGFESKLVEFAPEREYTLEQICEALQVVPAEADTARVRRVALEDDGKDVVLAWVRSRGQLISERNPEGWSGVVCPNAVEHTDGNPEGRYHAVNRAYVCLHAHCCDWTSARYLAWVSAEGGPSVVPGLREELLAQVMGDMRAKIAPTEAYPDAAAAVVAEVDRKELGRIDKAGWYDRFAYVLTEDAYFDLLERRVLTRRAFDALYRHVSCKSIHTGGKIEASGCYDQNRQAMGARVLDGLTYAAGESILVAREGRVYGNRWQDARPGTAVADVSPWLAHLHRMVPEDYEREHLLNVLAHKVQHANVKINHAVLFGGNPGSGKDTLFAPFFRAIGGSALHNCSLVRTEEIASQWGYALECEVMQISELRQAEAKDRRALENQLKPIIAAPPEYLTIQRKGLPPYDAVNRVFVVAFSNERAAITIPSDDRRWFCLWSDAGRLGERDASALWAWYHSGGFEAVAGFLAARDVSRWNPSAPPPMTEAKAIMVQTGRSGVESHLVELMERRLGEFARGVVGAPWHALADRLSGSVASGVRVHQAAIFAALKDAGWVDVGRLTSTEFKTKKHVFAAPEVAASHSKSDLRRMVEDAPPGVVGGALRQVK